MRKIALIGLLALGLTACSTTGGLTDLTNHLNERGCATEGSATASAGITGAAMGGNIKWSCAGAPRAPVAPPTE